MPEKRMLILPAELVRKIDENRGDNTQAEFIEFLIDSRLEDKDKAKAPGEKYVTREEFQALEEDIKKLMKSFLDFFVSYGLELGNKSPQAEFEELTSKLHELDSSLGSGGDKGDKEARIKWK